MPAGAFAAELAFTPSSLDFGSNALGETKKLTATLKNSTTLDIVLTGATLADNTGGFSIANTTCGDSLPAGQSCAYSLAFKSSRLKPGQASLQVATGDPAFPFVSLPLRANSYPALDDTGITQCGNASQNGLKCPVQGFPRQDAQYGRDETANKNANGHAGFSFTKLDAQGKALPATVKTWKCVRDDVTGLIWESKPKGDGIQGNQGLHDADDRYTWYSTDNTNNNGFVGYPNRTENRACYGYKFGKAKTWCNTEAYVSRVNAAGWCGAKDWRMPTSKELYGLVDLSIPYPGPTIDAAYFPDAESDWHWSGSPFAYYSDYAWFVSFYSGYSNGNYRYYAGAVRLVRGGQ